MKEINVTGQKRTDLGKKASKTLRKEGLIPCNLYGEKKDANGAPEALSFAVPFAELRKIDVTAPYQVIPEHLDIDVTALKIGKSIKVGDLSFEGLELATSKAVVVCSIKMTRNAAAAAAAAAAEEEA